MFPLDFEEFLYANGVNEFAKKNVQKIREIQSEIHEYYAADAAKYDKQNKLKITKIYDIVPSNMENKKKRVIVKDIESKKGKDF